MRLDVERLKDRLKDLEIERAREREEADRQWWATYGGHDGLEKMGERSERSTSSVLAPAADKPLQLPARHTARSWQSLGALVHSEDFGGISITRGRARALRWTVKGRRADGSFGYLHGEADTMREVFQAMEYCLQKGDWRLDKYSR